jgi:hypothetical protein
MRSIKLVPALAAAAMLLALAPAGASGKPRSHAAAGKCTLELEAPTDIVVGEVAKLQGKVECPNPTAAASVPTVTILSRPARRGRPEAAIGTAPVVSGASGLTFSFETSPPENTTYVVSAAGARSVHKTVLVSPRVEFGKETPADGSQLVTGAGPVVVVKHTNSAASHAVTFTGTVFPSRLGQIVILQREAANASEEFRSIDSGRVNGAGQFTSTSSGRRETRTSACSPRARTSTRRARPKCAAT